MQPGRISLLAAVAILFSLPDVVSGTPQIADEGWYEGKECVVLDGWWTKLGSMPCGRRASARRDPISAGYFFARAALVKGFSGV